MRSDPRMEGPVYRTARPMNARLVRLSMESITCLWNVVQEA